MKALLANPFFKEKMAKDRLMRERGNVTNFGGEYNLRKKMEQSGVKPVDGHPRFGYHHMLNIDSFAPLPTAPPIVGGNTDWTKSKVTPITQHLHNSLSEKRSMMAPPALDSSLKLGEPSRDSIHTSY